MRKKSRYRCRSLYESFVSRGPFAITNGWHALKNSFLPPSIQRLDERRRSRCPQSPQFSALCRLNGACTWGKSLFGDSWLDRGGGEAADRAVVRWSSAIIRKNRKFFALEEAIWNRGPALCLTHPFLCASMCFFFHIPSIRKDCSAIREGDLFFPLEFYRTEIERYWSGWSAKFELSSSSFLFLFSPNFIYLLYYYYYFIYYNFLEQR